MDHLFAVLFSYAVMITGLHADHPPTVVLEPKVWFDDRVCGGNHNCLSAGWYPATGGDEIYVLDTLDLDNELADSIVLHEMVHYLQHANHLDQVRDCETIRSLEMQAYGAQRECLVQEGVIASGVGSGHSAAQCADNH